MNKNHPNNDLWFVPVCSSLWFSLDPSFDLWVYVYDKLSAMILNLLRYPPIPIQFSDKVSTSSRGSRDRLHYCRYHRRVPEHPSWSRCFYVWIIQPALAAVGAPENPVEVITGLSSLPNIFPTASLNFDVGALMILKPQDYLLQQNSV
ncbi:hypothetical protein Ccrd_014832, partial [Cynara cardunculus var. scolymus]